MDNTNGKSDIAKLAYELTYHRYLINKDKARGLFTELTVSEYIALHSISKAASDIADADNKAYLKDLACYLGVSIQSMSKTAGDLKNRGLAVWSHDGDGSDGTYVSITELGIKSMCRQEEILKDYYSRVIEKFGYDNIIGLLRQIEKLEEIMDSEFTYEGECAGDRGT
ncbi:MAG: MarR family transcriptional regulator [Eubacteriales bacterium]